MNSDSNSKTKLYLVGMEVFILHYYGINVFLGVTEPNDEDTGTYIYEIDTVKNKIGGYEYLRYHNKRGFIGKKRGTTLIVPQDRQNTYCSKAMFVPIQIVDGKIYLLIDVEIGSPLFNAAVKLGSYKIEDIRAGTFRAEMISDGSNESYEELFYTGFDYDQKEENIICIKA